MNNDADILDRFMAELEKDVDMLGDIKGSVSYTKDYEDGYNDASVAIMTTVRTLYKKHSRSFKFYSLNE